MRNDDIWQLLKDYMSKSDLQFMSNKSIFLDPPLFMDTYNGVHPEHAYIILNIGTALKIALVEL